MLNEQEFRVDMAALAANLIPQIDNDYRVTDDDDSDMPGMMVTVGADADGWSYQTGDNSFTGGAYGYATWAVVSLYRDTDPADFAEEVIGQLYELEPDDAPIFAISATDALAQ